MFVLVNMYTYIYIYIYIYIYWQEQTLTNNTTQKLTNIYNNLHCKFSHTKHLKDGLSFHV